MHLSYKINVPTAFDTQLYFHAMAMMKKEFERKVLSIVQSALNITVVVTGGSACEEGLGRNHKVLFALVSKDCNTVVPAV